MTSNRAARSPAPQSLSPDSAEAIDSRSRNGQAEGHRKSDWHGSHAIGDRRAEELQRRMRAVGKLLQAAQYPRCGMWARDVALSTESGAIGCVRARSTSYIRPSGPAVQVIS